MKNLAQTDEDSPFLRREGVDEARSQEVQYQQSEL